MNMKRLGQCGVLSLVVWSIGLLWCLDSTFGASTFIADAAEKSDSAAIRTLLKQRADVNTPQAVLLQCAVRLPNAERNQ